MNPLYTFLSPLGTIGRGVFFARYMIISLSVIVATWILITRIWWSTYPPNTRLVVVAFLAIRIISKLAFLCILIKRIRSTNTTYFWAIMSLLFDDFAFLILFLYKGALLPTSEEHKVLASESLWAQWRHFMRHARSGAKSMNPWQKTIIALIILASLAILLAFRPFFEQVWQGLIYTV